MIRTEDFRRWAATLDARTRAKVEVAVERVAAGGPSLGRPRVDTLKDTKIHNLKEARIGRTIRVLLAFDPNRNLIVLAGGDKTGKGNRWYPGKIQEAERLYLGHLHRIGREGTSLQSRATGRTQRGMSR